MKAIIPIFILLLILHSVSASVSLGVSPGNIAYKNVLKGGFAQRQLLISTSKNESVPISIIKQGYIQDWLSIEPKESLKISRNKPLKVNISIRPPDNTQNGIYSGILHVRTGTLGHTGSTHFGSAVKADITVKISVEVTGQQIKSCMIGGVSIGDVEQGSNLPFVVNVLNDGNVIISPKFEIFIYDKSLKNILLSTEYQKDSVMPTLSKRIIIPVKNNLGIGQYWAKVVDDNCHFKQTTTFDVVAPGTIADKGELLKVDVKSWILTNETSPIKSYFKNSGVRPQEVKIMVRITKNGNLVKSFTTKPFYVLSGETHVFEEYFTPKEAGRYEVHAKAYFNKKVSYEKGNVINVNEIKTKKTNWLVYLIYVIMLFLIVLITRKIVKEKRKL